MKGLARKGSIVALVMALLAGGAWYGPKGYRRMRVHQLVRQARECVQKQDYRGAGSYLRRALKVNPWSKEATLMMAESLDPISPRAAVGWRKRLVDLEPDNVTNRFLLAEAALKTRDLRTATDALKAIPEMERDSAWFHKLSGSLAYQARNPSEAEKQYQEVLRMEPADAAVQVNLAMVRLSSTDPAVVSEARNTLELLATNPAVRFNALQDLAADAVVRTNLARAVALTGEIVTEPQASFGDKLDHLRLLEAAGNPKFDTFLAELKIAATNSPAAVYALARWMLAAQGPTNALAWLGTVPAPLATNLPVPLAIATCHVMTKNWRALLDLVQTQDWGNENACKFAFEALAARSLEQNIPAQAAWEEAFRAASRRPEKLLDLARLSASWGWKTENKQVLQEIIWKFPKERWAADQLISELYVEGDSAALARLLAKMAEADPEDARIKNNLANIYLLRKTEIEQACRLAREAYLSATNDPFISATYAYSLVQQNKPEEALQVINQIEKKYLEIPSVAVYYGIVQAEAGNKDAAREWLERAAKATLLPEERDLVQMAKAKR